MPKIGNSLTPLPIRTKRHAPNSTHRAHPFHTIYDLNGNVTQDATGQRFGYDAENHQKEFFASGNATATPDATYLYNGEGRRVKKTSNAETTVFVYNASGQLVAEYSTATATMPQVSYLTTDHLGSPRIITNEKGTVKDRKDYSAFGEESTSAQRIANPEYSAADQLRKNYTGYEMDTESGLEFAQARYYNPTHGRFTSVDPLTASASIRNPQTFNRYSYVLNSPYKFVDPLGLLSMTTGACGEWCQNSGTHVDGSAFSGTDTTLKKIFENMRAQRQKQRVHKIMHYASYDVHGRNVKDAIKSATETGKSKNEGGMPGETKLLNGGYQLDFGPDASGIKETRITNERSGTITVTAEIVDVTVIAEIQVTTPDWVERNEAKPKDQTEWDVRVGRLKKHEEEHVDSIGRAGEDLQKSLIGLTGIGSGPTLEIARKNAANDMSRKITPRIDKAHSRINKEGKVLDSKGNLF